MLSAVPVPNDGASSSAAPSPPLPGAIVQLHMPRRLVLVRHGESEANIIQRKVKKGELQGYPPEYDTLPDREFRLSEAGRAQTIATGRWLHAHYPTGFSVIYVSNHVRAMETCARVCKEAGWEGPRIRIDPLLGERNWGTFARLDTSRQEELRRLSRRDPLHAPRPDGETMLAARHRSRVLLERCAREQSDKDVLVFSHGEFVEAIWSEIAHMSSEQQAAFFESNAGKIRNCQIVEFSAISPDTNQTDGKLRWVRSSCPAQGKVGAWGRIQYQQFTPDELLEVVEQYPGLRITS